MHFTRQIALLPLVALVAACTQSEGDEAAPSAASTTAEALSGEAGFTTAANCVAQLTAVSRLYTVLANRGSGAGSDDFTNRAAMRELAADYFREIATRIGGEIGKSPDAIQEGLAAADAAVQGEYEKREFQDFAVWVAGEADKCPPPEAP